MGLVRRPAAAPGTEHPSAVVAGQPGSSWVGEKHVDGVGQQVLQPRPPGDLTPHLLEDADQSLLPHREGGEVGRIDAGEEVKGKGVISVLQISRRTSSSGAVGNARQDVDRQIAMGIKHTQPMPLMQILDDQAEEGIRLCPSPACRACRAPTCGCAGSARPRYHR